MLPLLARVFTAVGSLGDLPHGFTRGCSPCFTNQGTGPTRPTTGHSSWCQRRQVLRLVCCACVQYLDQSSQPVENQKFGLVDGWASKAATTASWPRLLRLRYCTAHVRTLILPLELSTSGKAALPPPLPSCSTLTKPLFAIYLPLPIQFHPYPTLYSASPNPRIQPIGSSSNTATRGGSRRRSPHALPQPHLLSSQPQAVLATC
jgi:hypothetical protein